MANLAGIIEKHQSKQTADAQIPMEQATKAANIVSTGRRDNLEVAKLRESSAMNQQKLKAETQAAIDLRSYSWQSFLSTLDDTKRTAQAAYERAEEGSSAQKHAFDDLTVAKNRRTNFMIYTSGSGVTMNMLRNASNIDQAYANRVFNTESIEDMSGDDKDTYVMNMTYFYKAREAQEAQKKKGASGSLSTRDRYQESYEAQAGKISAIDDASKAGKVLTTSAPRQPKAELGRNKSNDIFMKAFGGVYNDRYNQAVKGYDNTTAAAQAETQLLEGLKKVFVHPEITAGAAYNEIQKDLNSKKYDVNGPNYQVLKAYQAMYRDDMNGSDINANTGLAKVKKQSKADKIRRRQLIQDGGFVTIKSSLQPRANGGG